MKKLASLGIAIGLGLATQAGAAAFVNGGFEDGTFNGWSQNGGDVNTGPIFTPDGTNRNAITNVGKDANTGNVLDTVFSGAHSARVEDEDNGARYSTLTQSVKNYTDAKIFFAWAAVLEEPSHDADEEPGFSIILTDDTTSTQLYNVTFNVANPAPGVTLKDGVGIWKYTDWNIQDLDVSALSGHDFTLTVLAFDCTLTGHGGYAYVDGFGAQIPDPDPVPEPGILALLGIGVLGLFRARRK